MNIQQDLENLAVNKAIIKHSKQVKRLAVLQPSIKDNNETIHVNPTIVFQRLIVLIEMLEDKTRSLSVN